MTDEVDSSPAKPAIALGLTFLLIGLTFALPYRLIPDSELAKSSNNMAPEVANVYAIVAWAGWAHFLFAFRGQGRALLGRRGASGTKWLFAYAACVAGSVAVLLGVRWASGPFIFSAVVWIYFIDHFIKAERSFDGQGQSRASLVLRWMSSYRPLITFSWLSAVLLGYQGILSNLWVLWGGSLILASCVLVLGGWRKLAEGKARSTLISLFFIAEALVWGTYSQYGGPMFLTGVYVFHIAAASYFHYLGSYFFAKSKSRAKDLLLTPLAIVAVNAAIIALGVLVMHQEELGWLVPVLGIEWFTLWVAMHLVSSDLFPWFKARQVA